MKTILEDLAFWEEVKYARYEVTCLTAADSWDPGVLDSDFTKKEEKKKTRLIAGFLCLVLAGLAFVFDLDYFAFSWGSSNVQIYAAAALAFLGLLLIVTFRRQAS